MTTRLDLNITTFTRFFIGGQGPLQSSYERCMAGLLIALSGATAVAVGLHALSGLLWLIHAALVMSTTPVGSFADFALMFGYVCAASLGTLAVLFVIRIVVKRTASEK